MGLKFETVEVEDFPSAGKNVHFHHGGVPYEGKCAGLFVHQIEGDKGKPIYSDPALLFTPNGGVGEWFPLREISRLRGA